jgi:multidrug transporter EmrE-like cation transporter
MNSATRRYLRRFFVALLLYILFIIAAVVAFARYHPTGPLAYALAVLPALGIIGQMAAFGLYLAEEKDEFQRTLGILSMIWGIGATLSVTVTWGFLEKFVHLRHLDLTLVYPLYCVLTGISYGLLQTRYK